MSSEKPATSGWSWLDFDLIEKVVLLVMFGFFAWRMVVGYMESGGILNLMLLAQEALIVLMVAIRRRTSTISMSPADWVVAFGGTLLPLMVVPSTGESVVPAVVTAVVFILGFLFQTWAKLTLRRSFGVVAANRGVKTSGPYAFVRHPMYSGYVTTQLAFLLSGPTVWSAVVLMVAWGLQVVRILAEERVLLDDDVYRDMMQRVRWRVLPGVF